MKVAIVPIFLLVLSLTSGLGKEICPKMCICDVFEGYKRADCSDQNLASPYTNVAKSVEILNLSGNEITSIDNECLKDFKDLVKLSLARNSIHQIELFAFETLEKLNYLDLSDNRLEVIDNRILEMNGKLTFLDLSKNKFMLIDDKPLIISDSLEFLSLRNSHLSHVYDSFFSKLTSLVDLDVSNNLLITLMVTAFASLDNLQFINLEYNRFSCDFRIEETLQLFKQRKVHVKIDKCVKNSKKPMFEKMILHPDLVTEAPREDIDIDEVWGSSTSFKKMEFFDSENETTTATFKDYYEKIKADSKNEEEEEFDCDDDEIFPATCECHQKFIKYYEAIDRAKSIQKKNIETRLAIIFYLGVFLGIIAGCISFFVLSLIRKKCEKINQKQVERQNARDRMVMASIIRAETASPPRSPMPVIRNQLTDPAVVVQTNDTLSVPAATQAPRSPIPAPRNVRPTESPNIRRRVEPPARNRNVMQVQSDRPRVEYSPTAQLIHKLFRNRDPRMLPDPSEVAPLAPRSSRTSTRPSDLHIHEESIYSEIPSPTAPRPTEPDSDDISSQYLSIDNLSLELDLDTIRDGNITPPPAYRTIFDDDK